jgi:hypothetical protein
MLAATGKWDRDNDAIPGGQLVDIPGFDKGPTQADIFDGATIRPTLMGKNDFSLVELSLMGAPERKIVLVHQVRNPSVCAIRVVDYGSQLDKLVNRL